MKKFFSILCLIFILISSLSAQKIVVAQDYGKFYDGLAPILLDNKWGFIDIDGNVVIPPKFICYVGNYGSKPRFSEGLTAIVDPETERVGFINKKGEIVIKPQFYSAYTFNEDVAIVGTQNDHVIIDKTGKILAEKFVAINGYYSHFCHNRAICQKEFKYGFINKNGKFVVEPKYDEVRLFSNGLAGVKLNDKWGFIDTNGAMKIQPKYENEPWPFNSNRTFIEATNNKWGIIDTAGKLLVEPIYSEVYGFNNGFAVVSIMDEKFNSTYSIIDVDGKTIKSFPKSSNSAQNVTFISGFEGEGALAIAMKGGKYGMIDTKGNTAVNFLFRILQPINNGRAYFERFDEKTRKIISGFIDKAGKEIIHFQEPQF